MLGKLRMAILRRYVLMGLRSAAAVIVQTTEMATELIRLEGSLDGRLHVIPSGYRTAVESPMVSSRLRAALERANGGKAVSYVSFPHVHKNHDRLLHAWAQVQRTVPSARLFLTVDLDESPNTGFARAARRLRAVASKLGIDESIEWVGYLSETDVMFLLENSAATVFPSLAESFGLPLVEAMAAGCPIAASDLPYAREVARDAAIYFDPLDPDSIARTVVRLLNDQRCAARLLTAGATLRERYSYRTIAEKIADLLSMAVKDDR